MTLNITPKQLQILILLYRFRFLNRIQIQTILKHKDPKRINTWLKDLTNKKIIGRHYSKKLSENNKPAIYYLAINCKQFLINQNEINENILKRVYREKTRSLKFINHSLTLANFYLDITKNITTEKIHFFTKTDLVNYDYLPINHPDAYISKEDNTTKRYFFEIIDEGTPRFILRSKINQYIEYYTENIWQEKTGYQFPTVLLMCPNIILKEFLNKYINKTLEENQVEINFYTTTTQKIEWTTTTLEK